MAAEQPGNQGEGSDSEWKRIIKNSLREKHLKDYLRYEKLVKEYLTMMYSREDLERKVREFSTINSQALSTLTQGFLTSNKSVSRRKLDEVTSENKSLKSQLQEVEREFQNTKEQLARTETRLEVATENLEELKSEKKQLEENLQSEKAAKQLLSDEHLVLQSVLISHEKEIFRLKEENERFLMELLQLKERLHEQFGNMSMIPEKSEATPEDADVKDSSKKKGKHELPARVFCTLPTNCIKKLTMKDDVYAIKSGSNFTAVSSGDSVTLYKCRGGTFTFHGQLNGFKGLIQCIDLNPDETQVLTASSDRSCRLWNSANCKIMECLTDHEDKVLAARFSPHDPSKVVSGGRDRNIKLFDIASFSCVESFYIASSCIDLVPLSTFVGITIHMDKKCRTWDLRSKTVDNVITFSDKITSISYACNYFLVSSRNNTLYMFDVRQLKSAATTFENPEFNLPFDWSKASISFDGNFVACGSKSGSVCIWDIAKPKAFHTLKSHSNSVVCCNWSQLGNMVVSADSRRIVKVWT